MSFASPLALLAALAAAMAMLVVLLRRPAAAAEPLPAVLHAFVAGGRIGLGKALPEWPWRFALAAVLLAIALGRPQWGARPDSNMGRQRIVIALDLSTSMTATDAPPSRLVQARAIAERLVAQSPAADIGLIGFAGRAFLLAPPSADRALLRRFLPAVHPDQMLVPGSNLAAMLAVALDSFGTGPQPRTLVVLSDGEAEPTPWRALLPQLAARGIRVVGVGIGTPGGSLVRRDASGGQVRSRLDAATLRDMAAATGGLYVAAAAAETLAARVAALAGRVPAPPLTAAANRGGTAKVDRFGWFLLPAALLLAWSALLEWPAVPRLSRRRRRPAAAMLLLGTALALLVTGTAGEAVKPEPDPLRDVKRIVAAMLKAPTADDYLALATATAAYGEAHRRHNHPLRTGAVRDGLAAIDAGQALAPNRPDWAPLRARLTWLMRPRRTADDPEAGDGVPDGKAVADEGADADEAGFDPNAAPPDARTVGGAQRSPSDAAQGRVPSLVRPAFILETLRAGDQPATLFRALQAQDADPQRLGGQTW